MTFLEVAALVVALVWLITEVLVPLVVTLAEDRNRQRERRRGAGAARKR